MFPPLGPPCRGGGVDHRYRSRDRRGVVVVVGGCRDAPRHVHCRGGRRRRRRCRRRCRAAGGGGRADADADADAGGAAATAAAAVRSADTRAVDDAKAAGAGANAASREAIPVCGSDGRGRRRRRWCPTAGRHAGGQPKRRLTDRVARTGWHANRDTS